MNLDKYQKNSESPKDPEKTTLDDKDYLLIQALNELSLEIQKLRLK